MRATLPASLACLLCLLATLASAQTTRNVGSGQPYPTIQSGIDAATPGDTVLIAPGTYFENIDFHGKAITVTSSGGPAVTILDGSQTAPAVTFTTGETRAAILSNLTIQHGGEVIPPADFPPVGALFLRNSSPTIRNNVLTQNICWAIYSLVSAPLIQSNKISATQPGQCSSDGGAGIYVDGNLGSSNSTNDGSSPLLIGNTIENNVEPDAEVSGGAGISVWGGSPVILNNIIRNNVATRGTGGAIIMEYGQGVAIVQNLIYGNLAGCGGGALATNGSVDPRTGINAFIANNTIVNNTGPNTGGATECIAISQIYPAPDRYGESSPATILINNVITGSTTYPAINCIWYQAPSLSDQPLFESNLLRNTAGPFFGSYCIDVSAQDNNLALDPQFLNPATYDLHLQPTSPAINHGDPSVLATFHTLTGLTLSTDFDGNPRETLNGSACSIDMGAYQHTGSGTACGAQLTLQNSPNPSTVGQLVTFTAQLSGTSSPPAGDVQFTEGTTVLGTEPISATGASTLTTTLLSVGSHVITATWQPVGNAPGTQASVTQIVNGYPTTTALTSSLNPANVSQSVTFTATTTSANGTPTGTFTFADAGTTLAVLPALAGTATYTTATLAAGSHQISATFNPSASFAASADTLSETIIGRPTYTTLTVSPDPAPAFAPIALAGTVSSTSGTPTGSITFTANGITLGTAPVDTNGHASLSVMAPAPGTYSVSATYSGDQTYQSSASAPVAETVIAAASTTTLSTAPNPAYQGQPVTLSATITGVPGQTPTGLVTFYDGSSALASSTLSSAGMAVLTISTLAPGTHALTATYPGAGAYAGSTSPPVQQVILPGGFGIALTPSALTLHTGQQGAVQINLTTVGDFSGPLALSYGTLPTYASATISPGMVTMAAGGSGTATLTLTTSTVPLQARLPGPERPAAALAALLLLLLPLRPRLRGPLRGGLAMLLLATLLVGASGCGADIRIPFHTAAVGTYQLSVTATDANKNTHTAMLTITVTP